MGEIECHGAPEKGGALLGATEWANGMLNGMPNRMPPGARVPA